MKNKTALLITFMLSVLFFCISCSSKFSLERCYKDCQIKTQRQVFPALAVDRKKWFQNCLENCDWKKAIREPINICMNRCMEDCGREVVAGIDPKEGTCLKRCEDECHHLSHDS